MSQLYLKGVYYDTESEGFWFLNNSGTYEEITSGGGNTIYTGDGSLSGDRTVDLNEHSFQIIYDGFPWVLLDPANGTSDWYSINNDGATRQQAGIEAVTATDGASIGMSAVYGILEEGEPVVSSIVLATGTNGADPTINYTTGTHTFNGDVILADLAGGGTTGASIDDTGKIIRTP